MLDLNALFCHDVFLLHFFFSFEKKYEQDKLGGMSCLGPRHSSNHTLQEHTLLYEQREA